MISGKDTYNVFAALVPLYVAMILAYGSVRWWKIFTPDQCSGINRFVAVFAVPLLSFHVISSNDPYAMNYHFIAADSLQKLVILIALFLWNTFTKHGNLDWTITLFSLSTLPNTLVMGIPLLKSMYGDYSASLMVQIVVLQSVVWNTLLLFMFEYRGAKILIRQQFPETAASITSFKVDSDVVSLNGIEPLLEIDAEIEEDGKFHVVVKRSSVASSMASSFNKSSLMTTPRASNLSEVEIYSARSFSNRGGDVSRTSSNFEEEGMIMKMHKKRGGSWRSMSSTGVNELIEKVEIEEAGGTKSGMNGSSLQYTCEEKVDIEEGDGNKKQQMPSASVMTRLILMMVWRKLIRNSNTYASLLGLIWSLISYRWHIEMPTIVKGSISILSDAGLGMAMFSLGLFMALQPKVIACGKTMATFSMAVRFLTGPAVIAATSIAIGLRGDLLRVAIVQAALPQGIITFVFAKEYNLHADIISTSVIFGMLVALPVTILYYVLLGL